MNTTHININSTDHRLSHRPPLFVCDFCSARAIAHVHRIEGARVITATVCRECKVEFEKGAK